MGRKGDSSSHGRRAPNFSSAETEQLKFEIANRKVTLFASFSSIITFKVKEAEWQAVTDSVNNVGGNNRTVEQIKSRWDNISVPAKKKLADKKKSLKLTGGGSGSEPLSRDDLRMADVLGNERLEGVPGGIDSSEGINEVESKDAEKVTFHCTPSQIDSFEASGTSTIIVEVEDDDNSVSTHPQDIDGTPFSPATHLAARKKRPSVSDQKFQAKRKRTSLDVGEDPQTKLVDLQQKIVQIKVNVSSSHRKFSDRTRIKDE